MRQKMNTLLLSFLFVINETQGQKKKKTHTFFFLTSYQVELSIENWIKKIYKKKENWIICSGN